MNQSSGDSTRNGPPAAVLVWWGIWLGILTGLIALFFVLAPAPNRSATPGMLVEAIGIASLVVSSGLRWLVFPRLNARGPALVMFIVGIALAEACGFFGIFLSDRRTELFALGVMGILQWVPVFAGRFSAPRDPSVLR